MNHTHEYRQREGARERGQVLVMFLCFLVVLLLFVGLGIDLGFAYITQARLSKAVDAAALAAMNNYYQGTAQAISIGQATFDANFAPNTNNLSPGYVIGTPTPSIVFSNAGPNVMVNVSASATNKTFFIGMLPVGLTTLGISVGAQATRLPLIMTLVLDHSYSMCPPSQCGSGGIFTGGGEYLPSAVTSFISDFDSNVDQAAVISFGSTWTNDVPMTGNFQSVIPPAVNNIVWAGGTCSICGLTNALIMENSVAVPAGQQVVKAVVFFTDGLANMIESTISCPTGVSGPWNFGGYLPSETEQVSFWPTNMPATYAAQETDMTCTTPSCCPSPDTYQSFDGTPRQFNMDNVIYDATNQCILVAQQMQQQGMYVFCIGLDSASGGDVPDPGFLQAVANDPANPATYNPALPSGVALISGNGADLAQLFQLVAAQIQLRLTR
ncbi:MAG: VWA domain-containing protein [Verrucomicrobiia bacterium]|jgi:Flp pilus assembly protein TadG